MSTILSGAYDAACESAAFIRRHDRMFLRMQGRDPLRMIQGLVTNDVAGAPADRVVYAALLTPKGRMIADLHVWRASGNVLLGVPAGARDAVVAHLRKFVPPLFARVEDASDRAMLSVHGPQSTSRLARVLAADLPSGAALGTAREAGLGDGRVVVVATQFTGAEGWEVWGETAAIDEVASRLRADGVPELDAPTLDVLRIEAGEPVWGAELTDEVIPLEAGLRARAISESKGCYTGQEVIVRILHRGHVNRILRRLRFESERVPPPGAVLTREEDRKVMGSVTSSGMSPRYGPIGLGYVRREVQVPSEVLVQGGQAAKVEELTSL